MTEEERIVFGDGREKEQSAESEQCPEGSNFHGAEENANVRYIYFQNCSHFRCDERCRHPKSEKSHS